MRAIVVGGGVTGLAAALALRGGGNEVTVLEAASRVGGCLRSTRVGEFLYDDGPNSIPGGDEGFAWLIAELGLEGSLVQSGSSASTRWLFHEGSLQRLPTNLWQMMTSPLVGIRGMWNLKRERRDRPRYVGPPETVDAFLRRRFGARLTATFADAVMAGIYAGDPKTLGVEETLPDLVAFEREYGSVQKGFAARRRGSRRKSPPSLVTHRDGLGAVADAASKLLHSSVLTGARATHLEFLPNGTARVHASTPSGPCRFESEALVLATPPAATLALLRSAFPTERWMAAPKSASMALVQLGFDAEVGDRIPPGFGWLIPRSEGLRMLGGMVVSNIFPGRAPPRGVGLQLFFGGSLDPEAVSLQDDDLMTLADRELRMILKSTTLPRPRFARVVRWVDAIPQPLPGDAQRHVELRATLAQHAPRVAVAGSWIDGVAVGRCIQGGRRAAAHVTRATS